MARNKREKIQQHQHQWKLLSFSLNLFCQHKLIIFLLFTPFISINGDTVTKNENIVATIPADANNDIVKEWMQKTDDRYVHLKDVLLPPNKKQRTEDVIADGRGDRQNDKLSFYNFTSSSIAVNSTMFPYRIDVDNKVRNDKVNIDKRDTNNDNNNFNENGEKILSRRRRYLIFPPGSSVQIVYDTYHPILEYSNYLILGITAALAWELPSKPVYFDEELHNAYEMGNLPLLHRNDQNVSNINYTNTIKEPQSIPMMYNQNNVPNYYYTNVPSRPNVNINNKKYYSKYPSDGYFNQNDGNGFNYDYTKTQPILNQYGSSNKMQYYLSYADNFLKQFKQLTNQIPTNKPLTQSNFQQLTNALKKTLKPSKGSKKVSIARKHLVHPVFKKRNVQSNDELPLLEQHDLNLHRTTRHTLYRQMETFLKTQGSNGMECILKTLCETGQRRKDDEPGSMVVELLRAVFTLPEAVEPVIDSKHREYDAAHASKENCKEMFPNCKESVWGPKFHY